jgi:catechol 2,3-dioxygenase-like lactoylglutathione lyase family enzyme
MNYLRILNMAIRELNHFTLLAADPKKTIKFYEEILGLIHGPVLSGGFGYFLYFPNSKHAVIHMIDIPIAEKVNNNKDTGFQLYAQPIPQGGQIPNTGAMDHIAFGLDLEDFEKYRMLLKEKKISHRIGDELAPKAYQLWFFDPNGVKIELSFSKYES